MREDQLVTITDRKFDTVFDDWCINIHRAVYQLHQNAYFSETTHFYVIGSDCSPDRELEVIKGIQKIVRKHRKTDIETILVGYDTSYLKPPVLEAILAKIRTKRAYKDFSFSQITAAKMTQSVDTLLYNDYYIPDVIFVVIQR